VRPARSSRDLCPEGGVREGSRRGFRMFSLSINVDDSWISPVFEHVHHGKMFSLLELARLAWVESIGFPNDQLIDEGKMLVVTNVSASYKREVKRGAVQVTCDSLTIDDRTMRIRQRILNERKKVVVDAEVSLMFMDPVARRGTDIPDDFRNAVLRSLAESFSPTN
jgi:acyl-CoA thioesterase FadM